MNKWMDIDKVRPENGRDVLVSYKADGGRNVVLIAAYFGRYELECNNDSFGDDVDYCSRTDEYFAPEGWYEYSEHHEDYPYVYFANDVTHWMHKPEKPDNREGTERRS